MKDETPNLNAANQDLLRAITNAWKVLHVLGVSLAEVGRYWSVAGEDAGKNALQQVLHPDTVQGIFAAEEELRTALIMLDSNSDNELEDISERLKYWDGPDSPNEAPQLDLVRQKMLLLEEDPDS